MKAFTANVISILKQIPAGRVMTYGQVATVAGSPRGARQVVRILHSMSRKHDLPWHRVINSKGQIAIKDVEGAFSQQWLLEQEGIKVNDGLINLKTYRYHPELSLDVEQ
ncbi:MGMT family protein [Virgibacillus sp. DJP39]|uniref:MGMT family protein n=1 Tax=Virgibacillus sp. DJP39 TaxID=3409790 RepID=UPI003BB61592